MKAISGVTVLAALALPGLLGCDAGDPEARGQATAPPVALTASADVQALDTDGFHGFISPGELVVLQAEQPGLVVIDVRSPDEYAVGHIPGAINLPGKSLRTAKAKPGEGDSQYIFRDADGKPDVARYEQLFGQAGISRTTPVVVYGNHAGKGDGTIPAMLLDWLGHDDVRFLDGVGMSRWHAAALPVSTSPTVLPPATFDAEPRDGFLWTLDDVLAHVGTGSAVFYDTRSAEEFDGVELRSNARGGRIPGALHADYAALLRDDKTVISREQAEAIFASHNLPTARQAGVPIVLYCQTSTRVSLPYLLLRELGYENVVVYDASWHEYGNRADTPVERDTIRPAIAAK
jgi:thiosulfate/3-mercaptopyruvate sulfurtransferase